MSDTGLFDDEVVADSEDESEMDLYRPGAMGPPPAREPTSIYGYSPIKPPDMSSMSNFTAGPSNQPTYTSVAPATSANPKGKKADISIDTYTADFENISASIADRAKTRQRSQKRPSDVIELSSDDNFDAFHDPLPPKAKPKPKPKPKLKPNPAEKEGWVSTEPIATTSAATPGQAQAQTTAPRPRPRPRPVIKRAPPVSADGDTGAPYLPTSTPPGPELPIATSPFRYPVSLPPSDLPFPVSSVSTTYNELYNNINNTNAHNHSNDNIPRIETIRNSSPDSLFSERGAGSSASKRRRAGMDTEAEIDELATPPPTGSALNFGGVSPSKMPPPPTFFAGSSSSSMGQGRATDNTHAAPTPFPLNSNADLDVSRELEPPEPSLMIIDGPPKPVATTAAAKPKKQRKPEAVDDYEYDDVDFGAKAAVFDDDDMDCDFDPKGEGSAKTKKGKGKEKAKAKPKDKKEKTPKEPKAKGKNAKAGLDAAAVTSAEVMYVGANVEARAAKDATTTTPTAGSSRSPSLVGRQQVEVVIVQKPKVGADQVKKTTKDKEKGKQREQNAFKSREFIQESDDDMDLIGPPRKSSSNPAAAITASPNVVPTPEPLSGPSTKLADGLPSSSKKRSSSRTPGSIRNDDDDLDSPIPKASSSGVKRSSVTGKKKRKSIVDSDVDDDGDFQQDGDGRAGGDGEEGVEVNAPESSVSATKKRKIDSSASASVVKSKKGKKKSTVVLSDDDAGDEPTLHNNKEKGTTKGKKTSRKIVQDEEEEEEEQLVIPEVKSTPPESDFSVKENVEPPPKPVYSTPKPTSAHRPSTTKLDSDAKTPLYARYEIAPRKSSLPMSELIRRANSVPGSPFATPHASTPTSASSKLKPLLTGAGRTGATAYSPYMKASRSMLSRIAPLHPNRRTPPPPPPPPPPRKKSKKELEMEEKWEEEMIETVGGMEAWAAMNDGERREMRKAKWARELGGWDE